MLNLSFVEPELLEIFAKLQRTKTSGDFAQRQLMKLMWRRFNKHLFAPHGPMEEPNFALLNMLAAGKFKLRGRYWYPPKRLLEMSPRTFFAPFEVWADIFVHEMCHQATAEISKDWNQDQKGHGATWQMWMRKVGLDQKRFDDNDNYVYTSHQEKIENPGIAQTGNVIELIKEHVAGGRIKSILKADKDQLVDFITRPVAKRQMCILYKKSKGSVEYILVEGVAEEIHFNNNNVPDRVHFRRWIETPKSTYSSQFDTSFVFEQVPVHSHVYLINDAGFLVDGRKKNCFFYRRSLQG